MRIAFILFLCSFLGGFCNSGNTPTTNSGETSTTNSGETPTTPTGGMVAVFSLADTNGLPSTTFHVGESFDFKCVTSNLTDRDQVFHYTSPPVLFEIRQDDSTVTTSADGLAWPQVVLSGTIRKGESDVRSWRGPNSIARIPKIALLPGTYSAIVKVDYHFTGVTVPPPKAVQFVVQL